MQVQAHTHFPLLELSLFKGGFMKIGVLRRFAPSILALSVIAVFPAVADENLKGNLSGYNETPLTLSSPATAQFRATISKDETSIMYELTYSGFPTDVLQSHIHLGRPAITGGIMVFLCTNLGNAPTTVPTPQACPTPAGTITGTLTAADVIGPTAQGVTPGNFAQVVDAIRNHAAYVNIHSKQFPSGEVRSPVQDFPHHDGDHDHDGH
jgi:hypothetical protein